MEEEEAAEAAESEAAEVEAELAAEAVLAAKTAEDGGSGRRRAKRSE